MHLGFVLDRGQSDGPNVAEWIEGEPAPSFWYGLKFSDSQRYTMQAWRCPQCHLVRLYAQPQQ